METPITQTIYVWKRESVLIEFVILDKVRSITLI
jgi:hypothetical protein